MYSLKKIAQKALEDEYGFAPALNNIVLMEASTDGSYVGIEVRPNNHTSKGYQVRLNQDTYGYNVNRIDW